MTRILFVPVSGSAGSGEVQRCRLIAEAMHLRWPSVEPHFLLARGTPPLPWPTTSLTMSPTRAVAEVTAAIEALRPEVVVFDGNTRVAAMDAARRVGARVVLISSRPSARDRGFRWRRMARLSEHWLIGAELLANRSWRERLATRLYPRVTVRRYATLFAPPSVATPLLQRLGLSPPYAVLCPGGGRHVVEGQTAAQLFGQAATQLARQGMSTVAVAAPTEAPAIDAGELPNAELMALLSQAEVALLGGGSLLVQALTLGTPSVALPLQQEQAARVKYLADAGAIVVATQADPDALATDLLHLGGDPSMRAQLRQRISALGLSNGLPAATEALAALAGLDISGETTSSHHSPEEAAR